MSTKTKIITSVLALAISFAFGRYSAPESVKENKEIVQKETKKTKETEEKDQNTHEETKVIVVTKPDGTKEVTHDFIKDKNTTSKDTTVSSDTTKKSDKESKEITSRSSKLTLSALAGAKLPVGGQTMAPVYGGMVSKEVLGPISVGAFGLSCGIAGVSLGVSF